MNNAFLLCLWTKVKLQLSPQEKLVAMREPLPSWVVCEHNNSKNPPAADCLHPAHTPHSALCQMQQGTSSQKDSYVNLEGIQ